MEDIVKFREFLHAIGIGDIKKERFEDWDIENELMEVLLSSRKPIVIWGASKGGKKVLEFLRSNDVKVEYFIDSDSKKEEQVVEGLEVFSPAYLKGEELVVIGSVYKDEIASYLENRGIDYVCNVFSIVFHEMSVMKKNYSVLNKHLEDIIEVYNLLADEESKRVYASYIKYILTKHPIDLKKVKYPQYFHPNVRPEKGDIVVDGGAYIGDTIFCFLEREPQIKKIFSFEPDKENFHKLLRSFKGNKKVTVVNKALWSENGTLRFFSGLKGGSYVSENSGTEIECVSLDSFFVHKPPPTLIKLDVEGSEKEAILGGKEVISCYKPKLQICIYHDPYHLFEIPYLDKKVELRL